MSRIGVKRLPIGALCPGASNVLVVGIIIAKQNPRKIVRKSMYLSKYYVQSNYGTNIKFNIHFLNAFKNFYAHLNFL